MKLVNAAALALLTATSVFGKDVIENVTDIMVENEKENRIDAMESKTNIIDFANKSKYLSEETKQDIIDTQIDKINDVNENMTIRTTTDVEKSMDQFFGTENDSLEENMYKDVAAGIVEMMKDAKKEDIQKITDDLERVNNTKCMGETECQYKEEYINAINEKLEEAVKQEIPLASLIAEDMEKEDKQMEKMMEEGNQEVNQFMEMMFGNIGKTDADLFGMLLGDVNYVGGNIDESEPKTQVDENKDAIEKMEDQIDDLKDQVYDNAYNSEKNRLILENAKYD